MVFLYMLPVLIVAWFVQLVLHELSHLVAAYVACGYRPLKIRPYPVKWGDFARCEWSTRNPILLTPLSKLASLLSGREVTVRWSGLIRISAAILGAVVAMIWVPLSFILPIYVWVPFIFCAIGDSLFFFYTRLFGSKYSDGQLFGHSPEKSPIITPRFTE